MNSTKTRINQLLPILTNTTSKESPIKKNRRAKFNLRHYSQFENQIEKEKADIETLTLNKKVQTIKKLQRFRLKTQIQNNQSPQTMEVKNYSPQNLSTYENQSQNMNKLNQILKSFQKFKKQKNKHSFVRKQAVNTQIKSSSKKQKKQRENSSQKLSHSIRRYKNNLSFEQRLLNKNMAKKIGQIKPSREVSLTRLNKQYEQHQLHVHLREKYLVSANKKTNKRIFFG